MSATEQEMVTAVRAWATANYARGGDAIVECLSDGEIVEDLIAGPAVTTIGGAIVAAREFCGVHEEQKTNVLQPDENAAAWEQAHANAAALR